MDDYTALSDDLLEDFIESGNCQEKQSSKDIEGTNFKILSRICGKIKGLRFKILEFYRVMLLQTFKNFDPKLSNSLRCAEDEVGKLFWNTYDQSSSHGLNRCYILQLVLMGIL